MSNSMFSYDNESSAENLLTPTFVPHSGVLTNMDINTNVNIPELIIENNDDEMISQCTVESGDFETCMDLLTESEREQVEETILELFEEYIYGQLSKMSDPHFGKMVWSDITAYMFSEWNQLGICENTETDYAALEDFVKGMYDIYMTGFSLIPHRQVSINDFYIDNSEIIANKLTKLDEIIQAKQRTREWYEKRYQMITASNIYKALGSDAQRNSLIYEKCKPFLGEQMGNGYVNTESSLHWGVKYEPITALIYEDMFSVQIADYGCIPHPKYPFIGASPDGIVVDSTSDRYGHMVEIKNIVNRDITGIPKEEYWVQMQVQMEVCDLEYCDFVETRIKEYENADQYYTDEHIKYKGVVLYFVRKMLVTDALPEPGTESICNAPKYVYMPLNIPIEQTNDWIAEQRVLHSNEFVLYRTDYWYLDDISCVIVQRNRDWFNAVVPKFVEIWDIIQTERVTGYDHRLTSKKMRIQTNITESDNSTRSIPVSGSYGGICLIKLDEEGNSL